jgi:hypothetical protein
MAATKASTPSAACSRALEDDVQNGEANEQEYEDSDNLGHFHAASQAMLAVLISAAAIG